MYHITLQSLTSEEMNPYFVSDLQAVSPLLNFLTFLSFTFLLCKLGLMTLLLSIRVVEELCSATIMVEKHF